MDAMDLLDQAEDLDIKYPVEAILDERTVRRQEEYFVKWVGYATPNWEPATTVQDCGALDVWEHQIHANVVEASAATTGPSALNWRQAMKSEHATQFYLAAQTEMSQLEANNTWDVV